jgi:NAD(P)-dependent dehydrogenase (short-subunit alcohol dehydrogenase family)
MDKVVLVTGASSGIGKAVAELLAEKGFIVYGASRSGQTGAGSKVKSLIMDVTDESSVLEGFNEIRTRHQALYAVINNAGLGMIGSLEDTLSTDLRLLFDTNLHGVHHVCRYSLPLLRLSKMSYIVNVTSMAAQMGLPYRGAYCSSKFAVEGYSEALSQEVRSQGVRVVIVEPADVRTSINSNRKCVSSLSELYSSNFKEIHEQVNQEVQNGMEPERVAKVVLRILESNSPALRYRVAPSRAKLAYFLMRFLPDRLFESLIMRHYGIK